MELAQQEWQAPTEDKVPKVPKDLMEALVVQVRQEDKELKVLKGQ